MKDIYFQILNDPLASEEQKAQAQKMLDAAKAKTTPPEITGPVTLPDGPVHTRSDKTTYRSHTLVISRDYAADLQRRYGTLYDGKATEDAAGVRLQSAVDPMTDRDDFLEKFPDSLSFWDECQAKLKAFYNEIDAKQKPATKTETPVVEQQRPVTEKATETIPPARVLSTVDRLIATKKLLGK